MSQTIKRPRILVSGGTGFLGGYLIPLLQKNYDVTLISRSPSKGIQLDLSQWDTKFNPAEYRGKFDIFLHAAALYDLHATEAQCIQNNVTATHNALEFAQKAEIPFFVHISTVAVTMSLGIHSVFPHQLSTVGSFPDFYASSKAFAENLVRNWQSGSPQRLILRLGVLVGDTSRGKILRIDGPYNAAEFIRKAKSWLQKLPFSLILPGSKSASLPVVPVDIAAQAIVKYIDHYAKKSESYISAHYVRPARGFSAQQIYESALKHLAIKKKFILFDKLPLPVLQSLGFNIAGIPKPEIEYLLKFPHFPDPEGDAILGENFVPEFEAYEQTYWRGYDEYVQNH